MGEARLELDVDARHLSDDVRVGIGHAVVDLHAVYELVGGGRRRGIGHSPQCACRATLFGPLKCSYLPPWQSCAAANVGGAAPRSCGPFLRGLAAGAWALA